MLYFIFICLSAIFIYCVIAFDRDICAPALLFTVGFWLSVFWACFVVQRWEFDNTTLPGLMIGGTISFVLGCTIVNAISRKKLNRIHRLSIVSKIEMSDVQLAAFFIIEIFCFLITLYVVYQNTRTTNLVAAIGLYYYANKYGRLVYESPLVDIAQYINWGMLYVSEYILINNVLNKKQNKRMLYVLLLLSYLISLLQGTRTIMFMGIISGIIMAFLITGRRNGWKPNLNLKTVIKSMIIVILLGILLVVSITATGRDTGEFTALQTVNSYLGAPIKNLELFLDDGLINKGKAWGIETFLQLYQKLYNATGNAKFQAPQLYTYRWIGKEGLGNVYTIFMPLYYDFGVFGTCILMLVLGILSQSFYNWVRLTPSKGMIDFRIIIYSYVAFAISFSFFSNKIFELVIAVGFIYYFIGLVITAFILNTKIIHGKLIINRKSF